MIRVLLISLAAFVLNACSTGLKANKIPAGAALKPGDLYGEISLTELFKQDSVWLKNQQAYQTDPETITQLSQFSGPVSVEIFLGTWCPDSRREVPRFYKVVKEAGLSNKMDIKLYAVDRKKKLESGLTNQRKIEFVPTFIFYKNGVEIGRIIESPDDLIEIDVQNILSQN